MSNRRQLVRVNDSSSRNEAVTSGVPQGSVLGPILFLIYINDLADVLKDCHVSIFADDTKLYLKADSRCDSNKIQRDINRVKSWCDAWQLSLAPTKCTILHIGRTNSNHIYKMGEVIFLALLIFAISLLLFQGI